MIYKIDFSFLDTLTNKLPFLRYNDTQFYFLQEAYYSNRGKKETPWRKPKSVIIHRLTAEKTFKDDTKGLDFENHKDLFIKCCTDFLDKDKSKTLINLKHFLLIGEKNNLKATEISNWEIIEELFKKVDYKDYLNFGRYLIRIPCGSLNLNIVGFAEGNQKDLFLEITQIVDNQKDLKSIQKDLELKNPINAFWTDLAALI